MTEKNKVDFKSIETLHELKQILTKAARSAKSSKELKEIIKQFKKGVDSKDAKRDFVLFAPIKDWGKTGIKLKELIALEDWVWKQTILPEWYDHFFDKITDHEGNLVLPNVDVQKDAKDTTKSTVNISKMMRAIMIDPLANGSVIRNTASSHDTTTATLFLQINNRLEDLVPWYNSKKYWTVEKSTGILFNLRATRKHPNMISFEAIDSPSKAKTQGAYTPIGYRPFIFIDDVENNPNEAPIEYNRRLKRLLRNLRKGTKPKKPIFHNQDMYAYNNLNNPSHPTDAEFVKNHFDLDDKLLIPSNEVLDKLEASNSKTEFNKILKDTKLPFMQQTIYKKGNLTIRISVRSMFINTFLPLEEFHSALAERHSDEDWFRAITLGIPDAYMGSLYGPNTSRIPAIKFNDKLLIRKLIDPTFTKYQMLIGGGDWGQSTFHDSIVRIWAIWWKNNSYNPRDLCGHLLFEWHSPGSLRQKEPEKVRELSTYLIDLFKQDSFRSTFFSQYADNPFLDIKFDYKAKKPWQDTAEFLQYGFVDYDNDTEWIPGIPDYLRSLQTNKFNHLKDSTENYFSPINLSDGSKPPEKEGALFFRSLFGYGQAAVNPIFNNQGVNIHKKFVEEYSSAEAHPETGMPIKKNDHGRDADRYAFEQFMEY